LQAQAETILAKRLDEVGEKLNVQQGAVVVLGTDGAVRAMVGGRDYSGSQFNRATQALRQPGSAFKPFVYLAGLEGGYHPEDLVTDAPLQIGKWKPQNFTGTYEGPVSFETALAKSINTVAVRIAQHVGAKAVVAVAHRLGITETLKPELTRPSPTAAPPCCLSRLFRSLSAAARSFMPAKVAVWDRSSIPSISPR
jgi:penicillin-binding protein 1A